MFTASAAMISLNIQYASALNRAQYGYLKLNEVNF
jgi:hypothetical protein